MLTDDEIAALSEAERRELIGRLLRVGIGPDVGRLRKVRYTRLGLMMLSCVVLIPWTIYLAITLPDHYIAQNWTLTWVGFDLILLSMLAVTALLGFLRRQLVVITAFATGLLLICDAWFDITTAAQDDVWWSVASALLIEVPIALYLISGTWRMQRYLALRFYQLEPGQRLWRVPMLIVAETPARLTPRPVTESPPPGAS